MWQISFTIINYILKFNFQDLELQRLEKLKQQTLQELQAHDQISKLIAAKKVIETFAKGVNESSDSKKHKSSKSRHRNRSSSPLERKKKKSSSKKKKNKRHSSSDSTSSD